MFSSFAQRFGAEKNALYRLTTADAQHPPMNWVEGNVTRHGLQFPAPLLAEALADGVRRTGLYAPTPQGQPSARQAISAWYANQGARIPAEQLILTPGTSLGYAYACHLLINPGEDAEISFVPLPNAMD